jgi:hypothetical protein
MTIISAVLSLPKIPDILIDVFVDHLFVVVIGLIFFCLQLYLCTRFRFRMKRHQRELAKLINDMENEGDGRDIEAFVSDIPWLKWVDENFPRASAAPANYTRDDVLKELDCQIASDGHYLLLQRAGVMAPLLGVIITVIGFVMLLPKSAAMSEDLAMGEILYMVTPLVAGVGTGAVLAFINQWLLHLAGTRVETVRDAARTWFDSAIWRNVGLDVQAATVKAISAMERMAKSVANSAVKQEENADALRKSIANIYKSSDTFQETYAAFGEELGEMPKTLAEVTLTSRAAVEAIQSLVPVGERAVLGMDASVSAFNDAVKNQFAEAARSHRTTTESLEEAVGRINESTMQLKVGSGDLQETVNAHTNSFKSLNRSLQKQVLPAHESFLAAMSRFNGQADGLLERLDNLHSEVIASIEKMTSLAPGATDAIDTFTASTDAFSNAVQNKFAVAAQEHRENTDKLVDSVNQLHQSAEGLIAGGAAVEGLVTQHTQLGRQLEGMQQSLRQAIDQLTETGASLRRSFENEVMPSQRSMNEAADSFADSSQHLAAFIERGIDPVAQRFADMDKAVKELTGTIEAIKSFSDVRKDIEHLSQALAQAAQVAAAIAALPEQIRNVLEEVAKTHEQQALANSRGILATWFRGRKRASNSS